MPILLVPGLASSPRIYAPVIPALWRFGPVTVANHVRDDNMGAIARRILAEAPPRFVLAGHSMGGYIAFEIMRQAPDRVAKLALINTQARHDTREAMTRRRGLIARAQAGEYHAVLDDLFPGFVHPSRREDGALRKLVHDMGDDIAADTGFDQVSDPGPDRRGGQHHPEFAFEGDGRGHSRRQTHDHSALRPPA